MNAVAEIPTEARPVKLSCRNLWKIYGPRAAEFAGKGGLPVGEPASVRQSLQDSGHLAAVIDVSFDVHVGEIFIIMGLSGSGKSTLVRCLSRLVEPTAGHVLLDGVDLLQASERQLIDLRRRAMGMVFQNFGLLPHLTVLDNVAFPLRIQGRSTAERYARAREMIALVGLDGREGSFPHQLSGGQQQRVGIARSLAVGPELWFLDEPFSALDPLIRRQMQDEFLRLQRLLNKTIVFITHDIIEAFRLADRIAIMREGEIIQIGRPADIVLNPADGYVAEFTEDVPLLRVISAGDIMERATLEPVVNGRQAECILPQTPLEDLVPGLADGISSFSVTNEDGHPLGTVHAAAALAVLARDRDRRRVR
ncbi:MAG: glycine betaine/proline transport system ATP-binding protein [Rhodospirillaceae bacterium]|jgi:glycine betaine/proline transport system ATP-binding protein|nr:glycine betaine/proline transport system ATP-binding protein [Rhodospirillaceae bacterium]